MTTRDPALQAPVAVGLIVAGGIGTFHGDSIAARVPGHLARRSRGPC